MTFIDFYRLLWTYIYILIKNNFKNNWRDKVEDERVFIINKVSMTISSFAIQAMMYEVSCFPSPGLVSPVSNGSHTDMNFYTFIDSTSTLSKYLALFVQEGLSDKKYKEIFNGIRRIGVEVEKDMFAKTRGINTHKGMLFLWGLLAQLQEKQFLRKKDLNAFKIL